MHRPMHEVAAARLANARPVACAAADGACCLRRGRNRAWFAATMDSPGDP